LRFRPTPLRAGERRLHEGRQSAPDHATNDGVTAYAWEDSRGGVWWQVVAARAAVRRVVVVVVAVVVAVVAVMAVAVAGAGERQGIGDPR
jgi:hypothetical protein